MRRLLGDVACINLSPLRLGWYGEADVVGIVHMLRAGLLHETSRPDAIDRTVGAVDDRSMILS